MAVNNRIAQLFHLGDSQLRPRHLVGIAPTPPPLDLLGTLSIADLWIGLAICHFKRSSPDRTQPRSGAIFTVPTGRYIFHRIVSRRRKIRLAGTRMRTGNRMHARCTRCVRLVHAVFSLFNARPLPTHHLQQPVMRQANAPVSVPPNHGFPTNQRVQNRFFGCLNHRSKQSIHCATCQEFATANWPF